MTTWRNISLRITLLWVLLFLISLTIFSALASSFVLNARQAALDTKLSAQARVASTSIDGATSRLDTDAVVLRIRGFCLILYRTGEPIQIEGLHPTPAAIKRAAALPENVPATIEGPTPYRVFKVASPDVPGTIVAAFAYQQPIYDSMQVLHRSFAKAIVPIVLLSAFLGWLIARTSLAPVDRMVQTARAVARSGRLSNRFNVSTHDELGRLALTFNEMLDRIELSFQRERAFIGDVSHELRQPLAAIAAEAESTLSRPRQHVDYESALRAILSRTHQLSGTISDMLLLARADAGALADKLGRCEANEAVSEACADMRTRRAGAALLVRLCKNPVRVPLSAPLLERLISNLLMNAFRAAKSQVSISVAAIRDHAQITVDDDGPGIPKSERELIFRRFVRRDVSSGGTGLGLPIAAAIAEACGGHLRASENEHGGARFTALLPLSS